MKLNREGLKDRAAWQKAGIALPAYDIDAMLAETEARPTWVHFGSGSLFRAFHAALQQRLLGQGLVKGGVYAAETFDYDMTAAAYEPYDNLAVSVTLLPDGSLKKEVIASVAGTLRADPSFPEDYAKLVAIFRNPSLQLVTFTITEKGYALTDIHGQMTPLAQADAQAGPHKGAHAMSKVASLLWERWQAGGAPLAVVSTDNCSRNGEKLRAGVVAMAGKWLANKLVDQKFLDWLTDEAQVSFPWSMIDKITPRPADSVLKELEKDGLEGLKVTVTAKHGFAAPFVNAEGPQYLVIEDRFPNGRPPLEKAGVYLTDRDTVNRVEKMKVMTCLNPLHTALAVFGCLLGYGTIAAEMRDPALKGLVEKIGYDEGMKVVVDPGIIKPMAFIHEVIDQRLPNPYMPDTPQRIATDTSQKVPIRFGETIASYAQRPDLDPKALTFIPLAIAGWLRYLLAVDDEGRPMACSPDPQLETLQARLEGVTLGQPETLGDKLKPILANQTLFGGDLNALGLGEKITGLVAEMLAGPGAVKATLKKYVG